MEPELIIPKEIRAKYLERRKKDIETLRAALNQHTLEEFQRIGHQLKGNAASFGYPELEKVGVQMEAAGERGDQSEASRLLEVFQSWLNRVSVQPS